MKRNRTDWFVLQKTMGEVYNKREEVKHLTSLFRTSLETFWIRLRQLVREKAIEPDTAILAVCFEDDDQFEFGILITSDRRVIQFGVRYSDPSFSDCHLAEWNDLTKRKGYIAHHLQVAAAKSILDEDGTGPQPSVD